MKKIALLICLLLLIGSTAGCSPRAKVIEEQFIKIEEMDEFDEYNGFRVEEGRFYFTAIKEGNFNVYSIDLETKELKEMFSMIQQYDSFIPLEGQGAIYVDQQGTLYHKNQGDEKKIDINISGFNGPNVIVSPNRNRVLYTKGDHENSDLILYNLDGGEYQVIVPKLSQEAYKDFYLITQWASTKDYFIFHNGVFNQKGKKIGTIEATTTSWAPNDEYIAYIQIPEDQEDKTIIIGDWTTYIGDTLMLFNVETGEKTSILEGTYGFIDPISSIQWSQDGDRVAILEGEIVSRQGILERIDYQDIRVYNIENQEVQEVSEIHSNHYEFLFNDWVYTKNLGTRSPLEIIPIKEGERKIFEEPLILNNRSMFIIQRKDQAYFLNGRALMEINPEGKEQKLINLPWEPRAMFYDEKNNNLVIINGNWEMFLYPLKPSGGGLSP